MPPTIPRQTVAGVTVPLGVTLTSPQITIDTYDAVGDKATELLPNGMLTTYSYNGRNQLTDETVTKAGTSVFAQHYTLASNGRRDAVDETQYNADGSVLATSHTAWGYDNLDRLTGEACTNSDATRNYTDIYSYDLDSNRTSKQHTTTAGTDTITSSYNGDNELTQTTDSTAGTTNYSYDANGSQTNDGTHKFVYDLRNRLIQVTDESNNVIASYTYDYDGNRVSETTGGVTSFYLIDSRNPTGYAKPIEQWTSTTGSRSNATLAMSYLFGKTVIGQADSSGNVSYLLSDGEDNTRALVNSSGTVTATFNFDAHGNPLNFNPATAPTAILFQQTMFDAPSGLNFFDNGQREEQLGSPDFIEADPEGYGSISDPITLNHRLLDGANPISHIDLNGHEFEMIAPVLEWSASAFRAVLTLNKGFQASWGVGRELTNSLNFNTSDPFELAQLSQLSEQLQMQDVINETRRGVAVADYSELIDWQAIDATFNLNEQIMLDLVTAFSYAQACFAAGTPVVVGVNPDGSYVTKPIEDVHAGDRVLARDERNAQADVRLRRVEEVFSRETDHLRVLTVQDQQGQQATIRTTDGHLIWVAGRGWTKAAKLEAGDRLCDARGNASVVVLSNERQELTQPVRVYTFRVESDHTYFVSDAVGTGRLTAWVHNVCGGAKALEETLQEEKGAVGQSRGSGVRRNVRSKPYCGCRL